MSGPRPMVGLFHPVVQKPTVTRRWVSMRKTFAFSSMFLFFAVAGLIGFSASSALAVKEFKDAFQAKYVKPDSNEANNGVHLLPGFMTERLELTAAQQEKITALEKDTKAKLAKILTPKQKQLLEQAGPMRPGQGGPGGSGPGWRGPGDGPGGPGGPGGGPGAPGGEPSGRALPAEKASAGSLLVLNKGDNS